VHYQVAQVASAEKVEVAVIAEETAAEVTAAEVAAEALASILAACRLFKIRGPLAQKYPQVYAYNQIEYGFVCCSSETVRILDSVNKSLINWFKESNFNNSSLHQLFPLESQRALMKSSAFYLVSYCENGQKL